VTCTLIGGWFVPGEPRGPAPGAAGSGVPTPGDVTGSLAHKVAVVTGGAAGIGRATAWHLGALGARVVVSDVDSDGARQVAESMAAAGLEALGLRCDVAEPASVEAMVRAAVERFGGLDLLDHNAAWTDLRRDTDAVGVDLHTWERVLRTNSTGALLLTKAVVPLMQARGGGAIVYISSGSAAIGEHRRVAYGVSKAAIEQLTRHVAAHYAGAGIRCNAIAPGFVLTETSARGVPAEQRERLALQSPMGRLGTPEDVAHAVGFLLSERAGYINGQVLRVDGGLTISPRLPGDHR
jgi:NAD(P)-dependent dehydrogenase (short-subunit alcohol dehydrogenase family)